VQTRTDDTQILLPEIGLDLACGWRGQFCGYFSFDERAAKSDAHGPWRILEITDDPNRSSLTRPLEREATTTMARRNLRGDLPVILTPPTC
jgi:hypothetical protein